MIRQQTSRRALGLAVFTLTALLVPEGVLRTQAAQPPLQSQAEGIVGNADGWSAMAWSLDRKQPLFAINAEEIRIPASNNKVFTAIWALDVLGPDYRFPTDLLLPEPVPANGVVRGNVYLRGSGDPAFGFPEFTKDSMDPLRIMARQLKARGVRVVEGSVVGDGTIFDSLHYGPEWPRDTGNGAAYYAPGVSGLPFQRNVAWVEVTPTRPGAPAAVQLDPPAPIPLVSTVRTGGGRAWAVRKPDEDTIRVKGGVSGRGPFRYPVGVTKPALLAAGALHQALLDEGIQVRGGATTGATPRDAKLIHRHYSMRLADMIPKLNRDSDNFFAEHLWKAAVARSIGEGSYIRGGPASAKFFIRRAGVPHGQVWQADGSGLSAQNRTSALALVSALAYADQRPWSKAFHESLAVGGDPEGTMRRLFNGGPAEGNLHAKTGYINGVRSLSGYVTAQNGERVVFSFVYNGRNTSGARGVQEQLGNLLAGYSGS
jgi:D-alanyl-D-alanine carboxypeptidase/D-alanyl-D-alanine-endopeptidase (penicillin-binding protein 4)